MLRMLRISIHIFIVKTIKCIQLRSLNMVKIWIAVECAKSKKMCEQFCLLIKCRLLVITYIISYIQKSDLLCNSNEWKYIILKCRPTFFWSMYFPYNESQWGPILFESQRSSKYDVCPSRMSLCKGFLNHFVTLLCGF